MNKLKLILALVFFLSPSWGQAQEDEEVVDYDHVKNPFESQMPKIEPPPVAAPPVTVPQTMVETPLVPPPPKPVQPPLLTLTGVVWGGEKPSQAIIDGEVYGIGGIVKGARITKIRKSQVEVVYQEKNFTFEIQ